MERFNLEEYLAHPDRKVVTGYGEEVRIICTDRKSTAGFPIVALILRSEVECVAFFKVDGTTGTRDADETHLFFAPTKYEGWVNIYANNDTVPNRYKYASVIYPTKEEAEKGGKQWSSYVTTTKIEWEA